MAKRRVGHHLCSDFGHHLRAESRCGLRSSDELHGGGRPCCGLRRNCCICGFAECRDFRRLQHCDGTLSGPGRRPDGPTMATDDVCRAGWQFRTAARAGQPDELRHRAILQRRAGDRSGLRRRGPVVSLAAAAVAGQTERATAGTDLTRPAPLSDGCRSAATRRLEKPCIQPPRSLAGPCRAAATGAALGGTVSRDRDYPSSSYRTSTEPGLGARLGARGPCAG